MKTRRKFDGIKLYRKALSPKGEMICGEGKPYPFREKRSIFCSRWSQKAYQIISPQWEYSKKKKS